MKPFRVPLIVLATILVAILACGESEAPAERAEPAANPEPPPAAVLGLSEESWQEADGLSALFRDGHAWHVEQTLEEGTTLEQARVVAAALVPRDAELLETYSPEGLPELVVDLYASEWLKGQFASDVWPGGEPGQFVAVYGVFDGTVPRIVIGTGNQP